MPKRPTPESTTPDLTVRERMLLSCVASRTDWQCALGQVDHAYLPPNRLQGDLRLKRRVDLCYRGNCRQRRQPQMNNE